MLAALLGLVTLTAASTAPLVLEAEDATLVDVTVGSSLVGYSGAGYVQGFTNDTGTVEFHFSVDSGLYELAIGYSTPSGSKGYELQVNDTHSTGLLDEVQGFGEQGAGKYELHQGANTIIIGKGWGWYYLDYIKLTPATVSRPSKPPKTLIDPRATPSTRSLFAYLVDLFGRKILSGQQSMDEVEYVQGVTGKTPAIGAFDLIDYSPSRIQFGALPWGSSESWIDWLQAGDGIVTLCWHWNAPDDLINQKDKEWWRGFYTSATTFDLAAALADPQSVHYQHLLRDIDAIAVELQKFEDADVPVLWRPLHEASGGWFWWGASGPEAFKELWRLMVDRLVNVHGLHNLIWVYTSGDPDWYPGDAYVDVVSLDIYTDPSSSMSGEWEDILASFDGRKLITLSESGTLPDPDKVRTFATWWSWFAVWSGPEFIRAVDRSFLTRVYADEDVITRDELPDWRSYSAALYFAQFADGAGLTSELIVSNDDAATEVEVAVRPHDGQGVPMAIRFNGNTPTEVLEATIPPAGMRVFATDSRDPGLRLGSVEVASDGPVTGVVVFAGPGLGLAGVGSSVELAGGFSAPVVADTGRGIRTGLAIMNLELEPTSCSFVLLDPDGTESATSDGQLSSGSRSVSPWAPKGHASFFVDELRWTPSVDLSSFQGTVRVLCDGRTAATALQVRPGQFATLPVRPE